MSAATAMPGNTASTFLVKCCVQHFLRNVGNSRLRQQRPDVAVRNQFMTVRPVLPVQILVNYQLRIGEQADCQESPDSPSLPICTDFVIYFLEIAFRRIVRAKFRQFQTESAPKMNRKCDICGRGLSRAAKTVEILSTHQLPIEFTAD